MDSGRRQKGRRRKERKVDWRARARLTEGQLVILRRIYCRVPYITERKKMASEHERF
jgi:hypothetical protein